MRKLESELFPMTLFYIDDEESFYKLMKRFKFDDDDTETARMCNTYPLEGCAHTMAFDSSNGFVVVVTLGEQETEYRAYSVIIHESVHVWQFVKKAIREKKPGMETEAYATQYYATWLLKQRAILQDKREKAAAATAQAAAPSTDKAKK